MFVRDLVNHRMIKPATRFHCISLFQTCPLAPYKYTEHAINCRIMPTIEQTYQFHDCWRNISIDSWCLLENNIYLQRRFYVCAHNPAYAETALLLHFQSSIQSWTSSTPLQLNVLELNIWDKLIWSKTWFAISVIRPNMQGTCMEELCKVKACS